jgi:phage antirepressor YoqD-like protein
MGGRDLMAGVATMTSREIAELTGSSHDSVLKTVRRLNAEGVVSGNETPYQHPQNGQSYYEYRLSFRDTMVVVSGYSAELRAKIIDRWQELEVSAAPTLPQTFAQALRLAAEQAETIEAQAAQLVIAKPALAFVDNYVIRSTGSLSFRAVAKLIHAKENAFRDFLKGEKIMYQLGGAWHAFAPHLDAGRFEVRTGTTADGIETKGHAFTQTLFTPKGVSWIAGEWAKFQISNRDGGVP